MTSLKHSSSSGSSFSFFPNPRMEPTKKKKKSLITILLTKLVPLPSSNYKAFFAPPRELFEPSAIKIQYQSLLLLLLLEQILVVPKRIASKINHQHLQATYYCDSCTRISWSPNQAFQITQLPKTKIQLLEPKEEKKRRSKKTKKFQPYIVKNSSWDCTSSSLLPPSFLPSLAPSRLASFYLVPKTEMGVLHKERATRSPKMWRSTELLLLQSNWSPKPTPQKKPKNPSEMAARKFQQSRQSRP